MAESAGQTKGTVLRLVLGGVGMFGFAFALVPLYDVICEVTGLNGKTGGRYEAAPAALKPDLSRDVQVRFVTNTNAAMPWHFGAKQGGMTVNPGGVNVAMFYAENPTDRPMVAQTIPSIAPGRAASYFHKTECFCFDQQVLMPGKRLKCPCGLLSIGICPRAWSPFPCLTRCLISRTRPRGAMPSKRPWPRSAHRLLPQLVTLGRRAAKAPTSA